MIALYQSFGNLGPAFYVRNEFMDAVVASVECKFALKIKENLDKRAARY